MKLCMLGQSSRMVLAAAMIASTGVMAAPAAYAQAAPEAVQPFDIPAGDLTVALQAFSARTGMQLGYSAELTSGKSSPGVSGSMSPREALGLLLGGTGLSAQISGNSATLVQSGLAGVAAAEGERLLGPVRVEGSQGGEYAGSPTRGDGIAQLGGVRGEQAEEAIGYRAKVASVATGTPIAIEDIPRSISVQTQDQIEKQDIVTIGDALKRLPGVTVVESQASDAGIFVRGFQVNAYQVDGGSARPLTNIGNGLLGIDAYERVELVRGPNAIFSGENSAGGTVNLVRKRPGSFANQEITLQVGNYGRLSAVADISTPNLIGSIAFRGIASIRRDGSVVHNYSTLSETLYGIFDAPLGDSARLELGFNYNKINTDGENQGLGRSVRGNLFEVPINFNVPAPGVHFDTESKELFSTLYVDLASNWDLEVSGFYQEQESSGVVSSRQVVFNDDGSLFQPDFFPAQMFVQELSEITPNVMGLSAKLTGRFETFGLKHNVFANLTRTTENRGPLRTGNLLLIAEVASFDDMRTPNWQPIPDGFAFPFTSAGFSTTDSTTTAIVFGDTISWRDIVSLSATVRRDQTELTQVQVTEADGAPASLLLSPVPAKATWRPSFSMSVKPLNGLTLYGSYADGFTRQDSSYFRTGDAPNFTYGTLPPSTYKNKELGIRFARNKWLASLTAYQLDQTGNAVFAGIQECPPGVGGNGFNGPCFDPGGQDVRSKGLDVEINGEISDGLSVIASYNYNSVKKSPTASYQFVTQAPLSSASVFVDWSPRFAQNLSLQLGARYRGKYFERGVRDILSPDGSYNFEQEEYEIHEKGYVVVDLGADYELNDRLTLRVFVENITDKRYLSTINSGVTGGNFFGRPRSFLATLRWKKISDRAFGITADSAPFGKASDWYAAIDGGFLKSGDLTATATGPAQDGASPVVWDFDIRSREAIGGRIGYKLTDNLRVEIEGQYKPAAIHSIGGNAVAPFGVCDATNSANGVPFNCDELRGHSDQFSLLLNAIYEIGNGPLRPFVGGGVGITRHTMSFQGKLDGIGSNYPWQFCFSGMCFNSLDGERQLVEGIASADTNYRFSYQAIAGLTYKLSDRINVDLMYRYMDTKLKWNSYNLDAETNRGSSPLTPRLGDFKANSKSQMLTLGMRWAFGSTR